MLRKSLMAVMAGSALLIAGPLTAAPPGGDGGIFAKAPWNTGKGKKSTKKATEEQAQTASEAPPAPATGAADGNGAAPSGTAAAPPANGAAPAASNPPKPAEECTADKPC